ncbi:hypothetical protein HDU86_008487 [Geranomyces michiganensis]|nr:hypothetical protein HDU86_008487 [Geranomyces michiganensis]
MCSPLALLVAAAALFAPSVLAGEGCSVACGKIENKTGFELRYTTNPHPDKLIKTKCIQGGFDPKEGYCQIDNWCPKYPLCKARPTPVHCTQCTAPKGKTIGGNNYDVDAFTFPYNDFYVGQWGHWSFYKRGVWYQQHGGKHTCEMSTGGVGKNAIRCS